MKQQIKKAAIFVLTVSLVILMPLKAVTTENTSLSLLPPLCYVSEAYSTTSVSPQRLLTDRNVKIEVRFRLVDWIVSIFNK